jgi:hypothetical protein
MIGVSVLFHDPEEALARLYQWTDAFVARTRRYQEDRHEAGRSREGRAHEDSAGDGVAWAGQ